MSTKAFAQVFLLVLIMLASLAIPGGAWAGGVCGGTYIVDPGDTLEKIAATCGTSVSAIYAANPGISPSLHTGQTLLVPGSNYVVPGTNVPATYNGTYIVQYGDTFASIASRFGVSMYDLWTANLNIADINNLYIGQVIHVPAAPVTLITPTPTEPPSPLSYGTVPYGTPKGTVNLSNKANADVYVSLQGTTRDGYEVINEYPVDRGSMKVNIPAGWYFYVAWVGGKKFEGQFQLGGGLNRTITFYSNKVVVN